MKISRRRFLRISIGAGLLASSGYVWKALYWPSGLTPEEVRTLSSCLDTLIPADESPAASQVGVTEQIISRSSEERKYLVLLKRGCSWLDKAAGRHGAPDFASLSEEKREQVLGTAQAEPEDSIPRGFFERMRHDAFFYYYAHPESWVGLGYSRPPQPLGYPDYASPPKGRPG
jgi:hypothetical protein